MTKTRYIRDEDHLCGVNPVELQMWSFAVTCGMLWHRTSHAAPCPCNRRHHGRNLLFCHRRGAWTKTPQSGPASAYRATTCRQHFCSSAAAPESFLFCKCSFSGAWTRTRPSGPAGASRGGTCRRRSSSRASRRCAAWGCSAPPRPPSAPPSCPTPQVIVATGSLWFSSETKRQAA